MPTSSGTVNVSNLGSEAASADGLNFFQSASAGPLRFRTTVAEGVTSYQWNFNGSSFNSNATLLTSVGASAPTNIRNYIGVPVSSGQAFTLEVTYRQTGSPTAGKIALISNSGIVLHAVDAFANTEPATLSFTQAAGHSLSEVRILYSRENTTTGGLDLNGIVLQ